MWLKQGGRGEGGDIKHTSLYFCRLWKNVKVQESTNVSLSGVGNKDTGIKSVREGDILSTFVKILNHIIKYQLQIIENIFHFPKMMNKST